MAEGLPWSAKVRARSALDMARANLPFSTGQSDTARGAGAPQVLMDTADPRFSDVAERPLGFPCGCWRLAPRQALLKDTLMARVL